MVMRAMRENTKWIMLILTVAFVGWLVLDWVQSRQQGAATGPNPVVAVVNGAEVRYSQWNQQLEAQLGLARQQTGGRLTDEQVRDVRERTWDLMIDQILIEQELERLGITVTEPEIRQAFRTSPPPELRSHPAFQTAGQFDYQKYQAFFADPSVDEGLLLSIEQYYRNLLPRLKLERQLQEGVYVSDATLWDVYRDGQETAVVRFVRLTPSEEISDGEVSVTDAEVADYYRENREDFERPAAATVDVVSFSTTPTAEDTLVARARADSLRALIVSGETTFEDVAAAASADSSSAGEGGDLGEVTREELQTFPELEETAFSIELLEVSEPVLSPVGFHLLRVDSRSGDTVQLRHIVVPIRMTDEREDIIFGTMDDLEELALKIGLRAAADSLGIPVRRDVEVTRGSAFVPGAGRLGAGVDWAFDPGTEADGLSQFLRNASGEYILELRGRTERGTYSLGEVEPQIRRMLLDRKKRRLARQRLAEAAARFDDGASLDEVATSLGRPVEQTESFTRQQFVEGLGQFSEAIGAAFGLPIGRPAGPFDGGDDVVLIEVVSRTEADRAGFEEARAGLRAQLMFQQQSALGDSLTAALRENARVVDRRDELAAAASAL
jgi:peptidyl-prolyl cis-trans isomerase D